MEVAQGWALAVANSTSTVHVEFFGWQRPGEKILSFCLTSFSVDPRSGGDSADSAAYHCLGLAFVPSVEPCGFWVAVLFAATVPSAEAETHIVNLAVYKQTVHSPTPVEQVWEVRNLHPSTALLASVPAGGAYACGGVLALGTAGACVYGTTNGEPLHALAWDAPARPPVALAVLAPNRWLVGDDQGGLHMLDLGRCTCCLSRARLVLHCAHHPRCQFRRAAGAAAAEGWVALACSRRTSPATALCLLRGEGPNAGAALLFLGSHGGDSQLLLAPAAACADDAAAAAAAAEQPWQVVEPGFIESTAPAHDVLVVDGGEGSERVLLACGLAPCGTLRCGRLGVQLVPSICGTEVFPGRPRLLPAKAAWGDEHDAFLALSSEAGRRTAVLDVRGTHFCPADLPALDLGSATLALAAAPGGWLVQATAQEVRTLAVPGSARAGEAAGAAAGAAPAATWRAPAPLLSAAGVAAGEPRGACTEAGALREGLRLLDRVCYQVGVAGVDVICHVGARAGVSAAVYALAEEGLILRATPRCALAETANVPLDYHKQAWMPRETILMLTENDASGAGGAAGSLGWDGDDAEASPTPSATAAAGRFRQDAWAAAEDAVRRFHRSISVCEERLATADLPARGCVTALDAQDGGCVVAGEFLGALTVLHASPARRTLQAVCASQPSDAGVARTAAAQPGRMLISAGGGGLALLAQPAPGRAWGVVRGNAAHADLMARMGRPVGEHPELDVVGIRAPDGAIVPPIRPLLGAELEAGAEWPRDVTRLRRAPPSLRFEGLAEVTSSAEAGPGDAAEHAAAHAAPGRPCLPARVVYATAGGTVGLAEALRVPSGVAALLRDSPVAVQRGRSCVDRGRLLQALGRLPGELAGCWTADFAERYEEAAALEPLTPPHAAADVDSELWAVLDLCSDDELEEVHGVLFGVSPLSPVVKSLVADNEPAAVALRGRAALMHRLEARFRFLAADSSAVLRGHRPSYREALLYLRDHLSIKCPGGLATEDLETEIFLHLLQRNAAGVGDARTDASASAAHSDGRPLRRVRAQRSGWAGQLTAPLALGGAELLPALAKLGGALTVGRLRTATLRRLGSALLVQSARHEAALALLCRGGARGVVCALERRAAVQVAQHSVATAAARYGAARSALGLLGPLAWAWLGADLALRALGTDYCRVVRAVFALAQVRLLRTNGFTHPAMA
ncbi:hypothetical protein WJX81_003153 [Elliptochloris bilobata]|uniref:Uncharacterized protein n=1 Tax=Elliptochloris bilobata TaxID=381761 RepID=A0AAW1QL80_9CHLO